MLFFNDACGVCNVIGVSLKPMLLQCPLYSANTETDITIFPFGT